MVAPIRYLSRRVQEQKIGILQSTEDEKVLEVIGRVGIGSTVFDADYNLDVRGIVNIADSLIVGGDLNVSGVSTLTNLVEVRSDDGTPGRIDYYCEVSNAHYTRIQAAPHSEYSGNVITVLPTVSGDLIVGDTATSISQNLNTSGIITASEVNPNLLVVSGVSTFTGAADFNSDVDIDGHTELDDLNVSGVSTFSSDIYVGSEFYDGNNLSGDFNQVLSSTGIGVSWITPINTPSGREILSQELSTPYYIPLRM